MGSHVVVLAAAGVVLFLLGSDPDNVGRILTFLEDACLATAAHVSENWQDPNARKAWEKIARRVASTQLYFLQNRPY